MGAGGLALAILGWALAILLVQRFHFAVLAPRAQSGVEAAAAFAKLFGALVLGLFFADRPGEGRLLWVAAGLLVLGLGGLGFDYLEDLIWHVPDLNAAVYESLVVWTVAGALFAVGLVPRTPPRFGPGQLAVVLVVFGLLGLLVDEGVHGLPPLALIASAEAAVALGSKLPGGTRLGTGRSRWSPCA